MIFLLFVHKFNTGGLSGIIFEWNFFIRKLEGQQNLIYKKIFFRDVTLCSLTEAYRCL
jgi:hypothetical protein